MFQREVKNIRDLVMQNLRINGLETPLQQKRLVEAWPEVVGEEVARYSFNLYIQNQTLFVHLSSAALRHELMIRRYEYVRMLNQYVGADIIVDIRFC